MRGIHRWPVNFPHKWPVTRRKIFPFDDVIMKKKAEKLGYKPTGTHHHGVCWCSGTIKAPGNQQPPFWIDCAIAATWAYHVTNKRTHTCVCVISGFVVFCVCVFSWRSRSMTQWQQLRSSPLPEPMLTYCQLDKLPWNSTWNTKLFIHKNAFEMEEWNLIGECAFVERNTVQVFIELGLVHMSVLTSQVTDNSAGCPTVCWS